jgi:hypothetical protein
MHTPSKNVCGRANRRGRGGYSCLLLRQPEVRKPCRLPGSARDMPASAPPGSACVHDTSPVSLSKARILRKHNPCLEEIGSIHPPWLGYKRILSLTSLTLLSGQTRHCKQSAPVPVSGGISGRVAHSIPYTVRRSTAVEPPRPLGLSGSGCRRRPAPSRRLAWRGPPSLSGHSGVYVARAGGGANRPVFLRKLITG